MNLRVMIAGEGPNEIGSFAAEQQLDWRQERSGVIGGLLRQVREQGWEVHHANLWRRIRKFTSKPKRDAEIHTILVLTLQATEHRCEVLAFARDEDNDSKRAKAVQEGTEQARQRFPQVRIVGGPAIPLLEGWILAILGQSKTEALRKDSAKRKLSKLGIGATEEMVAAIEREGLAKVRDDAKSL